MKLLQKKSSFTLIELLIVAGIFGVVIVVAAASMASVTRAHRRLVLQDYVMIEARHLIERIAREVYQNTIDYEEYYSKLVTANSNYGEYFDLNPSTPANNGYGFYAWQFYNPGSDNKLGCTCSNDANLQCPSDTSCIIYRPSVDVNTGLNPYNSTTNGTNRSAFNTIGIHQDTVGELYLINSAGTQKTIFVLEDSSIVGEKALSVVKLDGYDKFGDDGYIDSWKCTNQFNCNGSQSPAGGVLPNTGDKTGSIDDSDFVPITPRNVSVKKFALIIMPQEDPYKAFSEDAVQMQPRVTIILTLEATQAAKQQFRAEGSQPIILQTTITSQVHNEVVSYKPQ